MIIPNVNTCQQVNDIKNNNIKKKKKIMTRNNFFLFLHNKVIIFFPLSHYTLHIHKQTNIIYIPKCLIHCKK